MSKFSTERLRFDSEGDTLVADLFRPPNASGSSPIVVTTGSWTTSKEQQANFYAREIAGRGLTALTFDFRGFGQSGGEPRDWEHPQRKADDIAAAITFTQAIPGVDPDRVGVLGVCASAGYQAVNAARDDRVKAIGMVAPWLHNTELVAPYYGGDQGVAARIELSRQAAAKFEASGVVDFMPAISETDESAAMYGPFDYYLDPQRGAIPEWDARLAVMSWEPWLTFNPIDFAREITAPVLMVHSEDAAVPEGARRFHEQLPGSKELIWTTGTQLDFYDQPTQVDLAVPAVVDHFNANL